MDTEERQEPTFRQKLLQHIVLGTILITAALAVAYCGVDYEMSKNCRSTTDPSIYGQQYCILPQNRPRPPKPRSSFTFIF